MSVFQNTLGNSGGGERNRFEIVDVDDVQKVKDTVRFCLSKIAAGHVLVKWDNKLFVCERDNVNPDKDYIRHEVSYHPLMNKFTL